MLEEFAPAELIHLYQQRTKLRVWVRTRLWAQVLIAMILGVAVGLALGPAAGWVPPAHSLVIADWLALPGQLFLGLILLLAVMIDRYRSVYATRRTTRQR